MATPSLEKRKKAYSAATSAAVIAITATCCTAKITSPTLNVPSENGVGKV